jgi:dihydrofolate reductase/thymidylate synthase
LADALALSASVLPEGRAFVIGGARLFEEALADCRHVYETLVADDVPCDVFAPSYDHLSCSYVSKTFRENCLRFDYRLYYNQQRYPRPSENLFGEPEHEEYQYLRAIKRIIESGEDREDRTGTGTRGLFGEAMRYDLSQTFPLLTHKKVFWRGVAEELLWFISGSTDADVLERKGIKIWAGNSSK